MWLLPEKINGLATVIVPTYNRAPILIEAISSVYNQTYRPIELIIVDDGSADSTKDVVNNFKDKIVDDKLFTVKYIQKVNEGCQKARNVGIECSKGEFIQLLDSDDILCPKKIENAVNIYKKDSAVDLVFSSWVVDNGRRIIPMRGPLLSGVSLISDVVRHNLCIFSPLYRRKTIIVAGPFNEELLEAHDIEYSTRVMQYVRKAERDDDCGGVYRIGTTEASITGSCSPGTLRSEWLVNRWQKKLIRAEPPEEIKERALEVLTRRAYSIATRSLQANCPNLGLRILVSEYKVWFPLALKPALKCIVLTLKLVSKSIKNSF